RLGARPTQVVNAGKASGPSQRRVVLTPKPRRTRMKVHANAALGPAGRLALVEAIESGMTLRAAPAPLNAAPATAHRWWHRFKAADPEARSRGSWLQDRSSRPHRQPRRLTAAEEEPILPAPRPAHLRPPPPAR